MKLSIRELFNAVVEAVDQHLVLASTVAAAEELLAVDSVAEEDWMEVNSIYEPFVLVIFISFSGESVGEFVG